MDTHVMAIATEHAPWKRNTPWWVVGLQAIVVLVIGLYLLLAPGSAGELLVQLIALAVLLQCGLTIAAALPRDRSSVNPYTMLQTGIGAFVGLLVLARGFLVPTLDIVSAKNILAWGLLIYVIIEVAGVIANRAAEQQWLNRAVTALLLLVLAILLLSSGSDNATDRLSVLGWTMVIGGIILALLAFRAKSMADAVTSAGVPAA